MVLETRVVMCGPLHSVSLARLARLLPCAFALLSGCGAADGTKTVREEPPDDLNLDTSVYVCPTFIYTMVLPQAIRPGEMATVAAFATDLNFDDNKLKYVWSATSGDFDKPNDSLSRYICADAGPQVLNVTASDPDGCENHLDFNVVCGAP
jgi:hypothetical protein